MSKLQSRLAELKKKIKVTAEEKRKNEGQDKVISSLHLYGTESFLYNKVMNEEEEEKIFKKIIPKRQVPELKEWPPVSQTKQYPKLFEPKVIKESRGEEYIEKESHEQVQRQIRCMIDQKDEDLQSDIEDDGKMRQIIVNTIRNKKPAKGGRRFEDVPTPFEDLSEPYQLIKVFAEYLPKYQIRREKSWIDGQMIIDLGVKYVHEVVVQCIENEVLPKEYLKCYVYQKIQNEMEFIKNFSLNDFSTFNFQKILFTSIDHRELCQLLIDKFPERYTLGEKPYCLFKELSDFYQTIYSMDINQYRRVLRLFRQKYHLYWWDQIGIQNLHAFPGPYIDDDKFDTSTIYQPAPSPLFGANIDDPDNDFEKAKNRMYPTHEYRKLSLKPKTFKKNVAENQSSSESSSSSQNSSNEDEGDSQEMKESQERMQSNSTMKVEQKAQEQHFSSVNHTLLLPSMMNSQFQFSSRKINFDQDSDMSHGLSHGVSENNEARVKSQVTISENQTISKADSSEVKTEKKKRKKSDSEKKQKSRQRPKDKDKNKDKNKDKDKQKQRGSRKQAKKQKKERKQKQVKEEEFDSPIKLPSSIAESHQKHVKSDIYDEENETSKISSIGFSVSKNLPSLSEMDLMEDNEKQKQMEKKDPKKKNSRTQKSTKKNTTSRTKKKN